MNWCSRLKQPQICFLLFKFIVFLSFLLFRVLTELVSKMRDMQMDKTELGCLRAIVLFNPGSNQKQAFTFSGSFKKKSVNWGFQRKSITKPVMVLKRVITGQWSSVFIHIVSGVQQSWVNHYVFVFCFQKATPFCHIWISFPTFWRLMEVLFTLFL